MRKAFRKIMLAALPLLVANLFGQDSGNTRKRPVSYSSSSSDDEAPAIPRIWFGLAGSYSPFKLVSAASQTNSTTGETISSTSANGQAAAGANLNVRMFGSYWLNIGGMYRFGGYDTTDALNDSNGTQYLERTRARLFDFPVLLRYAGSKYRWNKHSFYEIGGAIRYANSIKTTNVASNSSGYFCCAPASTVAVRNTIEGVVLGTGLVGRDDFGIKVAPEVRYIRWMGDTFRSPTVGTQRDQLELAVTFGF